MNIVQIIAEHVAATPSRTIPASALEAARAAVCDTLALGMAGRREAGSDWLSRVAALEAGPPVSTLWSNGSRTGVVAATLVNGFRAGALDYDSLHPEGLIHPAICSVPAALAIGELARARGIDVLCAIAIADDVGCRLALAHPKNKGWYFTALYGPMIAAVAAARVLRLGSTQVADALGLAYIAASGTQIAMAERSLAKRLQTAQAAAAGVRAAFLAAEGYPGPRDILQGPLGVYQMYECGDPALVTQGLGTLFRNTEVVHKLYPNCGCSHAVLEGVEKLLTQLNANSVSRVDAVISPYMQRLVGAPFDPAASPEVVAQFSLQYAVACTLARGRFALADLRPSQVQDPNIAQIAAKVVVDVDDRNSGGVAPATVRLHLSDGSARELTIQALRRADPEDLRAKFEECLLNAGRARAVATKLFARVRDIDQISDVSQLFDDWPAAS